MPDSGSETASETVQWAVRCHDGTILPMHHDGEQRARGVAARAERPTVAIKRAVGPWVDADAASDQAPGLERAPEPSSELAPSPLRQGEGEPEPRLDDLHRALARRVGQYRKGFDRVDKEASSHERKVLDLTEELSQMTDERDRAQGWKQRFEDLQEEHGKCIASWERQIARIGGERDDRQARIMAALAVLDTHDQPDGVGSLIDAATAALRGENP